MRNKVTPTNPNTARQSAVRARLSSFSQAWKGLTQAQRDAWNAAVSGYTKTNVFGDTVNPSGKNLYTGLNSNLEKVGYSAISVPAVPESVISPDVSDAACSLSLTSLEFDFAAGSADQTMFVQMSTPVSPGITNISSKVSLIGTQIQTTPATVDLWTEYVAIYGTPAVGQKIFMRISAVRDATGQSSTPAILSCIVAA